MKINMTQEIVDLDGAPIITGRQVCQTCGQVVSKPEKMTVRLAATRALTASFRDEQSLPGDQKITRFHLALRLTDEDEPSLTVEEIALVKKLVGKMYGPVVVGRMWGILDPPEEAK